MRSLTIGVPSGFDLHALRGATWDLVIPTMNYLVQNYQRADGVGPDLAQRWEISPDGKVYTFFMVKNAKWHDGRPVTAADVVFSFKRIASDPSIPAAPYRFTFSNVDKIEAPDDYTVRITLKNVSASFLALLGSAGNVVYPQHALDSILNAAPIGSGPFKFSSYQRDVKEVLEKNGDYFKKDARGGALPYLDRREIFIIPNAAAKIAAFRVGQVDVMDNVTQVSQSDYTRIKGELGDVDSVPIRTGWIYWLFRNKPPFDDVRVRRAFHLAMDRQAWDTIMNEGQGDPFTLYMTSGSKWAVPPSEVATFPGYRQPKDADIAQAKSLLKEANFDLSKPVTVTAGTYEQQAAAAAGILEKNLGVKTVLKVLQQASFTKDQQSGAFDILYDSNSAAVDDPTTTLPQWYRTGGNNNWGGWSDPNLDKVIDTQEATLDPAQRLKLVQDIQKKIALELFWTPTNGALFRRYLWRSYVKGWVPHLGSQDGPAYRHETTWLDK